LPTLDLTIPLSLPTAPGEPFDATNSDLNSPLEPESISEPSTVHGTSATQNLAGGSMASPLQGLLDTIGRYKAQPAPNTTEPTASQNEQTKANPPKKVVMMVNGTERIMCTGPICQKLTGKNIRGCSTCSQLYCQKCCHEYRQKTNATCSETRHTKTQASNSTATPASSQPSGSQSVSQTTSGAVTYNPTLPLRQEHYEAQRNAERNWRQETDRKMQQQAAVETVKRRVVIHYWASVRFWSLIPSSKLELTVTQEDKEPKILTVACSTFPAFSLDKCSTAIQAAMSMTADRLIETFDPAMRRWQTHELTTPRSVEGQESLLYRADGVSDGKGMDEEVEKLLSRGKPQKRPIDLVDISEPDASRRVRQHTEEPRTPARSVRRRAREHTEEPRTPRPRDATPKPTMDPPLPITPTPLRPSLPQPRLSSPHLSIRDSPTPPPVEELFRKLPITAPTKQNPVVIDLVGNDSINVLSDTNTQVDNRNYDELPSSNHSPWPLMYVKSMAEGFSRMDTMTGTLEHRFLVSFPSARSFSKVTWHANSRVWDAASEDLKQQFINAAYTSDGRWKSFKREVEQFHGGFRNIPGKRSRKNAKIDGGQAKVVKKEPTIIVLDDD